MGKSELYKKFLLQKTVLDTLRVYINITDEFLQHLHESNLLDDDELMIVKKLGWPSNRNQLLQSLIKRQWNKQDFSTFCNLLENTQEPSLATTITKKADEYFKGSGFDFEDEERDPTDPVVNMLDNVLVGISLQDQNKIRRMLREKDDQIANLKNEKQNLETNVEDLTAENADMKIRLHTLDNAATDLVSAFEYDHQPETVEEGLGIVRNILDSRQKQIDELDSDLKSLLIKLQDQKDWSSKLTTEVLDLKEVRAKLEKELEELKQIYHKETFEQHTKIEEHDRTIQQLKRKIKAIETYYVKEVNERDEEMEHMKKELAIAERMQNNAVREKNKVVDELDVVKDKTRKLLISLGLENEVQSMGVALDFARNISIATRKKGTIKMNSRPKLNPINSEDDQLFSNVNLPWGNTPQDIQARRDSVSIEQLFPPQKPKANNIGTDFEIESSASSSRSLAPLNHIPSAGGELDTPRKSGYTRRLPPVGENS